MVQEAITIEQIEKCSEAMRNLRPNIESSDFLSAIQKMINMGYRLFYIEEENKAVSVAGFITGYNLYRGNYIYIDDLNTLPGFRKRGYAKKLLDKMFDYAISSDIKHISLDSGVNRFDAHRLYLNAGFIISSHHFELKK